MELSQLQFAHPLGLWISLAIPLVWITYFLFYRFSHPIHPLEKFIDRHLLPYLLMNHANKPSAIWKNLLVWSVAWSFLSLAFAGPRWNFREMETFSKDQSLVILLDLSESMNAVDIKPSRLVRAKQKIEDILNVCKGVKVGLIAFAADPHMITPLTDDKETIRHLLPTLNTDLIYVQGSRLSPALEMASTMLEAEPGNNKAILVMSDGGFEDSSAIITTKKLAEKGMVIHAMGIGTTEGAPIKDLKGNTVKKNGIPIHSKLEKERFSEISKVGKGRYLEASYSNQEEETILKDLEARAESQLTVSKKSRYWDERFYLFLLPVLPIMLRWFRRGSMFVMFLIFLLSADSLQADISAYFKNSEQRGKQALEAADYETATHAFQDSYRKGVAYYKAGNFAEAENMFRQSTREDVVSSALYNLGNTLVQQRKFQEAIATYEDVLKKWPDHTKAKENLALVKKMLEQQQENKNQEKQNQEKQNQEKQNQEKQNQENSSQNESQSQDKSQEQNSKDPQQNSSNKNDETQLDSNENQPNNDKQNEQQSMKENQELKNDQQQEANQEPKEMKKREVDQNKEQKSSKSQEDHDADLLLNRIANDPKTFMKNKFYIESKKNGTMEGIDPW